MKHHVATLLKEIEGSLHTLDTLPAVDEYEVELEEVAGYLFTK